MKTLFLSPPATSYLEPKPQYETPLEVVLPRIPFEVLGQLNGATEPAIIDLEWEMDKHPAKGYSEIIANAVRRYEPDVVLTSIFAQSVADAVDQITTAVREEKPDVPIVVGGQAIPNLRERVFQLCPSVNAACLDALALHDIISHLNRATLPKMIFNGGSRGRLLPSLAPHLLYRGFPIGEFAEFYRTVGIEVCAHLENQRGCPFDCTFCAVPRFVQERPVEATFAEAEYLLRYGISTFYLTDLTFGLNRKKAKELLLAFAVLHRRHPRFRFRCITRVDFIDSETAELLKTAGCYEIAFGVETSSTEVLRSVRKDTTREQNLEAIVIAAKAGLAVRLFLIVGMPGEDIPDLFRFLREVNGITRNTLLQISLARPIAGTVFEQRVASGKLGRGSMHQLDFRTDGRRYGLDTTQGIVNFILLGLAWPSTEISRKENRALQDWLALGGAVQIYAGVKGRAGIKRREDIILIDACGQRFLYVPQGLSVKIRQCLMQCSDDFFEFLVFADGTLGLEQITQALARKLIGRHYYKSKAWASRRTREIFGSLTEAGLVRV